MRFEINPRYSWLVSRIGNISTDLRLGASFASDIVFEEGRLTSLSKSLGSNPKINGKACSFNSINSFRMFICSRIFTTTSLSFLSRTLSSKYTSRYLPLILSFPNLTILDLFEDVSNFAGISSIPISNASKSSAKKPLETTKSSAANSEPIEPIRC